MNTFANLIEEIQHLSIEEMQEIQFVTERYIAEKKRKEFYVSHKKSLKEYKDGKLKFSSDIDELKSSLGI